MTTKPFRYDFLREHTPSDLSMFCLACKKTYQEIFRFGLPCSALGSWIQKEKDHEAPASQN